jgi:hypothetical protein
VTRDELDRKLAVILAAALVAELRAESTNGTQVATSQPQRKDDGRTAA